MSQESNHNSLKQTTGAESFHDDDSFAVSRNPLSSLHNFTDSPDVSQKALLSEMRKLTFKVNELQNYCDDYEAEKKDFQRDQIENGKRIGELEERCRSKERELADLRDTAYEAVILRDEKDNMANEVSRLVEALRVSQERVSILDDLVGENMELVKKTETLSSKVKALESFATENKSDRIWKPKYEQAKGALEKAERTIFEYVRDSERARAASEAEAVALHSIQSQPLPWSSLTPARCTCTCHHHSQIQAITNTVSAIERPRYRNTTSLTPRPLSAAADSDPSRCSTPSALQPPETTQNMADMSVVDVSLWRDTRSTPSDVTGECLGEVLAVDSRIQDLGAQLAAAREEVRRANEEMIRANEEHEDTVAKLTTEKYLIDTRLSDLTAEKASLVQDLEKHQMSLEGIRERVVDLSSQLTANVEALRLLRAENADLGARVSETTASLQTAQRDNAQLRKTIVVLETSKTELSVRELQLLTVQSDIELQLSESREKTASLEIQLSRIEEQVILNEEERERLTTSLSVLEAQNGNLIQREARFIAEQSESKEIVSSLEKDLKQLKTELDLTREQLKIGEVARRRRIQRLEERLVVSETQLTGLTEERDGLASRLSNTEADMAVVCEREASLAATHTATVENLLSRQSEIAINHEQLRTLNEVNGSLRAKFQRTQEDFLSLSEDRAQLNERITALESEKSLISLREMAFMTTHAQANERIVELQAAVDALTEQLALCQKQLAEATTKAQDTCDDLDTKTNLVEHLKTDRVRIIEARDTTAQQLNCTQAVLSETRADVARLSAELLSAQETIERFEHLESSIGARESSIGNLNQALSVAENEVSRLLDKKNNIESDLRSMRLGLDRKTGECTQITADRNALRHQVSTFKDALSVEKAHTEELEITLTSLQSDFSQLKAAHSSIAEKCTVQETELADFQYHLTTAQEDVIHLAGTNQRQLDDISKLGVEGEELKRRLEERAVLVVRLEKELAKTIDETTRWRQDAQSSSETVVTLVADNSRLTETLRENAIGLDQMTGKLNDLQENFAVVSGDRDVLIATKADLSEKVSSLEIERTDLQTKLDSLREEMVYSRGPATQKEVNSVLESKVRHLRGDLFESEQREAETNQAASMAAFRQQFAENKLSRLTKCVEALERRVDAATMERLACEERLSSEAVRCRQLEGTITEKDSIIGSLHHQVSQLEAQKRLAEDAETNSLLRFLRSKMAQDEAEKKLTLFEVNARKSAYSLDQLSATLPTPICGLSSTTVADYFNTPMTRRHSDFIVPQNSRRRPPTPSFLNFKKQAPQMNVNPAIGDIDMDHVPSSSTAEKSVAYLNDKGESLLFEDAQPNMASEILRFKTPIPIGTQLVREPPSAIRDDTFVSCMGDETKQLVEVVGDDYDDAVDTEPSHIHFITSQNILSCTPYPEQEEAVDGCDEGAQVYHLTPSRVVGSPSVVSPTEGKSPEPLQHIPEIFEHPRCSPALNTTCNDESAISSEPVSEIVDWPPYHNCVAPLSPQALRGERVFTVPVPHEFHFRRLQRLLIAPAASEETGDPRDCDTNANHSDCLEIKEIPRFPALEESQCSPGSATKRKSQEIGESYCSAEITTLSPDPNSAFIQAQLACIQPRGKVGACSSKLPCTPNETFRLEKPLDQLLGIRSLKATESHLQRTPSDTPLLNVKTAQLSTYLLTISDDAVARKRTDTVPQPQLPPSSSSRSHSVSRPSAPKLARFRSFQDRARQKDNRGDSEEDSANMKGSLSHSIKSAKVLSSSARSHLPPPQTFQRFKDRFAKATNVRLGSAKSATCTPVASRRPSDDVVSGCGDAPSDSSLEVVEATPTALSQSRPSSSSSQSSLTKTKKPNKMRFSNVFKSKAHK